MKFKYIEYGQTALYFSHPLTMKVGKRSFQLDAGFISNLGGGLVSYSFVGQKGFFDKFTIKFNSSRNEVELESRKN